MARRTLAVQLTFSGNNAKINDMSDGGDDDDVHSRSNMRVQDGKLETPPGMVTSGTGNHRGLAIPQPPALPMHPLRGSNQSIGGNKFSLQHSRSPSDAVNHPPPTEAAVEEAEAATRLTISPAVLRPIPIPVSTLTTLELEAEAAMHL
ncbi:hypothetical protein BYT27DRAFT_7251689 [Phlegmacium glaucopus]|nr:hypothetical protein BYT27DRAFT_7251689 [Phlegmacium glaucopus]